MEFNTFHMYLGLAERITFLRKFIESPSIVGSITPSSRFLAQKMLKPIDWNNVRALAELGAGTGALTKYIHARKHPRCKVAVFEKDKEMRDALETLYNDLVYFEEAACLSEKVRSLGMDSLDAVVSGLPFALFAETLRERIIDQVIQSLKPKGIFVTFQYSLNMKQLLSNKFSRVDISYVPLNLPPAFVYVCSR